MQVSAALLRIGTRSPYFATLAMHARYEQSEEIPTAATDGRTIFINKSFWEKQTVPQADGLLLHEVLHAALLHVARRHGREAQLWNIAADAVINGMILREGYELPEGGVIRKDLEHLSTDEAYDKVLRETEMKEGSVAMAGIGKDLLDQSPSDAESKKQKAPGNGEQAATSKDEDFWRKVQEQAQMVAAGVQPGKLPGGLKREVDRLSASRLDWRSYLWRYLTQTPTDFNDFDRRFVGGGMYLDTISGESVKVLVCVDTSGSINHDLVKIFVSEVQGILRAYPQMKCDLFYADAAVHGPFALKPNASLPTPVGGGGTDFRPFFEQIRTHPFALEKTVAIYLTDGYGTFPSSPPKVPTLWVVVPGGIDLDKLPFGESVRLLPSQH